MVMREFFKKVKVNVFWLLQPIQRLLCSNLWLREGRQDYFGQVSPHASQALRVCFLFFLFSSVLDSNHALATTRQSCANKKVPLINVSLLVADFPAVFFHISHWYLSWNRAREIHM